jgi:hypothetical protein
VRPDLVSKFCEVANVGQSRPSLLASQRQQGAPGSAGPARQRSPRSPPRAGPRSSNLCGLSSEGPSGPGQSQARSRGSAGSSAGGQRLERLRRKSVSW